MINRRWWAVGLTFGLAGSSMVLATLATPATPSTAAPAGACHLAWVTNEEAGTVSALNVDTRAYGIAIEVGGHPRGVAVAPDGTQALVTTAGNPPTATDSRVTPVDLAALTAGAPIPVPTGPQNVAITPDSKRALVTSQQVNEGQVTPIDLVTHTAGSPIAVPGALPIAVTPDGALALVGEPTGVVPIDLATDTAGTAIGLPDIPVDLALTPDGAVALITLPNADVLQPMVVATGTLLPPIAVPGGPISVAVTPDGETALVGTTLPAALFTVDLVTRGVSAPHLLPTGPNGTIASHVAISSDGQIALVANGASNETFPVALPAVTIGVPISNGVYRPPNGAFDLAFDARASAAACAPAIIPPPTTPPVTLRPSTVPPQGSGPAVATRVAPAFTG